MTVDGLSDAADRQLEQLEGYAVDAAGRTWCRHRDCQSGCQVEVAGMTVSDDVTGDADCGIWRTTLTRTVTLHPCGHRLLATVAS